MTKTKILKKFEVTRYYRDLETWEVRQYDDGEIALGVGGELYNIDGVEALVSGSLAALHLMRELKEKKNTAKRKAPSRQGDGGEG